MDIFRSLLLENASQNVNKYFTVARVGVLALSADTVPLGSAIEDTPVACEMRIYIYIYLYL